MAREKVDREAGFIRLGDGGNQINDIMQGADGTGIDERSDYYIENVFEELDAPGEWYADRECGHLYYYPPVGLDLRAAVVEVRSWMVSSYAGERNGIPFGMYRLSD